MKTNEFIKKLKNDIELAKKLSNVFSVEEAYQIAKDNGVTDDKDAFCQEMSKFREEVSKITLEDTHDLVGCTSTSEIVSAVSTCIGAAATAASAAV